MPLGICHSNGRFSNGTFYKRDLCCTTTRKWTNLRICPIPAHHQDDGEERGAGSGVRGHALQVPREHHAEPGRRGKIQLGNQFVIQITLVLHHIATV